MSRRQIAALLAPGFAAVDCAVGFNELTSLDTVPIGSAASTDWSCGATWGASPSLLHLSGMLAEVKEER